LGGAKATSLILVTLPYLSIEKCNRNCCLTSNLSWSTRCVSYSSIFRIYATKKTSIHRPISFQDHVNAVVGVDLTSYKYLATRHGCRLCRYVYLNLWSLAESSKNMFPFRCTKYLSTSCAWHGDTLCSNRRQTIASMKSIGDNGYPCPDPLRCLIGFPGVLLNRPLEEVLDQMTEIRTRHLCPNPIQRRTSSKYFHQTLSKALAMSSLMNNNGVLALWKRLIAPCTYWKLSRMYALRFDECTLVVGY
jgi:hypothetical protein